MLNKCFLELIDRPFLEPHFNSIHSSQMALCIISILISEEADISEIISEENSSLCRTHLSSESYVVFFFFLQLHN